jgi:hypothetical protein
VPFWESWAQPAARIARKIPNETNNNADVRMGTTLTIFCFRGLLSDLIRTVDPSSPWILTNGSCGSPHSMHDTPGHRCHGAGESVSIAQTGNYASDYASYRIPRIWFIGKISHRCRISRNAKFPEYNDRLSCEFQKRSAFILHTHFQTDNSGT